MRRRCYNCKCLEEESSHRFNKRTKDNPKARFYCIKCDPIRREMINKSVEKGIKTKNFKKEIKSFQDVCRVEVERVDQERKAKFIAFSKTESAIKGRRRYFKTDKGKGSSSIGNYNYRIRKMGKSECKNLSREERKAIGRFYLMCPLGYEVDHIIPVSKGGKHELSNLQYLTKEDHKKKTAKDVKKVDAPKTICGGSDELEFTPEKTNKSRKYNRVRMLITKWSH